MTIVLGPPTVEQGDGRFTLRVAVRGFPGPTSLWFSVPLEAAALVNIRVDAALVALLMPGMAVGHDIVVDGPITDELAWTLRGDAQEVIVRVRPELSRVNIEVRDPVAPMATANGVATGYSAGVDSYATLARHFFPNSVPESLRLTHLLYNNVGSHGHGGRGRALFRKRLDLLLPNALSTGLPLIDVDSNVDDFHLAARLGFQQSHTMRNAAVAHLLSAGIRQYLYASSVPYEEATANPRLDLGFADTILLPLISTRSLILRSSGSDMDRSAKTQLVADIPHTYERLDVCVQSEDGTNCSECWKCHRTMLTLDLTGALERYGAVFQTPQNPAWREDHLVFALTQNLPSARSLVRLYEKRRGIPLRLRARAHRQLISGATARFVRRAARYAGRRAADIFERS